MAVAKTVESAFNPELGNVLRQKHPRWRDQNRIRVEQTNVLSEAAGLHPDLIVRHFGGLPVAVETEYAPANSVEQDACERLGKTLRETGEKIEQALAVRVPKELATRDQSQIGEAIETAKLEFCIFSGNPESPDRWPQSGWIIGGVDDLAGCIELAALSENQITRGMETLELGIGQAANLICDACADVPDILETIARKLHQRNGKQTQRMAMAILTNALTFHMSIAGAHGIKTLDELMNGEGVLSKRKILEIWGHIITNINYWPIFKIASDILRPIRDNTAHKLLSHLLEISSKLNKLGATSQHDFCGRMFQRLITDRKFLATFYTLPSSAVLLAELAIERLKIDWSDRRAVTKLQIGDFACGTGALLNAAYGSVLSRYRRKGGDDRDIHAEMMEHALVGADIMPAATHLTASVLSSTHPCVIFANTSIVTLPYGKQPRSTGRPIALGALDLIEEESTLPLFGTGQQRVRGTATSGGGGRHIDILHGRFDIVIMNPPFTRPTNHESTDVPVPSFAGFSTKHDEQKAMSKHLRSLRCPGMAGHGNAGLASYFIDIAHAKLRSPGGVLALVLPATFSQGGSWDAARKLLDKHYQDVMVTSIVATGVDKCAFSADTGLAEVLVVATRRKDTEEDAERKTKTRWWFANLDSRPKSILEAKMRARTMQQSQTLEMGDCIEAITIGNVEKVGSLIQGTIEETGYVGVRELSVARTAIGLGRGELLLPREQEAVPLRTARLGDLGRPGLLSRDINGAASSPSSIPRGPFDIFSLQSNEIPTYPALWRHDASREKQMIVLPDSQGQPRTGCDERAIAVWKKIASRLHFSYDFRLNSQPLAACLTPERSIGGQAWPNFLSTNQRWDVPLVLWANTILGLVCMWWIGTRQQQGRARLSISRLPLLVVLDVRRLTKAKLDYAEAIFTDFQHQELLAANEAYKDEVRQALDRTVLIDWLGLSEDIWEPLTLLRDQWCAEPSVHGGKKTAITLVKSEEED